MLLSFFRERVVFALLMTFTASPQRCFALYIDNNVADFGHRVTPLQTQHFQMKSVMKFDLCNFHRMTKYENSIVVLCAYYDPDAVSRTYIRIYEDQDPFDLLMIIDAEVMQHPSRYYYTYSGMVSSSAAKSIFIALYDVGVWQMRWNDHQIKRFPFPGKNVDSFVVKMSTSEQGHLQLFDRYNVFVYDSEGTLIRKMPLYATIYYRLYTPIGEYRCRVSFSTSSSNSKPLRLRFDLPEITLREVSDAPDDVTENGTTECIHPSLTRSIFLPNIFPVKYPDFELNKFSVSFIPKGAEFKCSKQAGVELFNLLISVGNNQLNYEFFCNSSSTEEWCLLPNASDSLAAKEERMRMNATPDEKIWLYWKGSYFFDRDKNQLVLSFISYIDYYYDLFVLRLE